MSTPTIQADAKCIKVFSSQFNYQYGSVIHFPFSIASLVAYLKSFPSIDGACQFEKVFVFRNLIDDYVGRCVDADILLCSCYVWNWEITTLLARRVKEVNPQCLVVFGGPQVPMNYEGDVPRKWVPDTKGNFFEDYPFVDIVVHQEGELTLKSVFDAYLGDRDYSSIRGLETREFRTAPADRVSDLDALPSPYLGDLMWDLVETVPGVSYIASWETNRGCPYQCTYCDWGSATKSKVRKRSMDTLMKEIEWFADNKIPYIDICDANFGIFVDRDFQIARKFKEEKLSKGFPGRVRPAWAKASSDRLIPIAKELLDADLLRAVTLAVQSLDPTTLSIVKRANIKFNKFSILVQQFRAQKIETYTDFILGMPGETLTSYLSGLEQVLELFPRPVVFIYNCGLFVNAPMNAPDYIRLHGIKVIKSPIYLWHSSVNNRGTIPEYEYITIAANSFSLADLKVMYIYGWAAQALHSMGILEFIAKFFNQLFGTRYIEFYGHFFDYCKTHPESSWGREYRIVEKYVDTGYSGGGWDHHDPDLAPIYWPIEEATWLRCVRDSGSLAAAIGDFISFLQSRLGVEVGRETTSDLIDYQVFLLSTMDHKEPVKHIETRYNWPDFFERGSDTLEDLQGGRFRFEWDNKVTEQDRAEWCYKAIWVGRNQGNYKCFPEFLRSDHIYQPSVGIQVSELGSASAG